MTLIVGIKAKDGIVVASDGAATLGSMGQQTAQQPTKKLYIVKDKIVVGVSGPVGLGQSLRAKIESMWNDGSFAGKKPHEARSLMSRGFREYILPELEVARVAGATIGNVALSSALSSTLVALPISSELCLIQFDQQGASEEATEEIPFVCIGNGQSIADPFLAFLRRVFWADHQPTIDEALFAAIWAVNHAIQVHPGGVAEPMQVITITQAGQLTKIREISPEELIEHKSAVSVAENGMKNSLKKFKDSMAGEATGSEIPTPVPAVEPNVKGQGK